MNGNEKINILQYIGGSTNKNKLRNSMNNVTILLILILFIVACEAAAHSYANDLLHTGNYWYLFAGAFLYMIVVYLLSLSHKYANMGIVNAIWSGLSVIAIASVGWFIHGQKVNAEQAAMMGVIAIGVAYLAVDVEEGVETIPR